MRHWYFIFLFAFIGACGEKQTDLTGNTPLKINDFNKIFKLATLPVTLSDSTLSSYIDTLEIGRKALAQFLPDSALESIISATDKKSLIHPIFKIVKEEEYYILLFIKNVQKQSIAVVTFSKKNKFLGSQVIATYNESIKNNKQYGKTLIINKEPTFLVEENKLGEDNSLTYEKKGWAYTQDGFRLIFFDTNKKPTTKVIINPLDTLPMINLISGDYSNDPKNFISIRDNGAPNKYQFFLHFEKKENTCVGELKGLFVLDKNQATYTEKGDACIIHFNFKGNTIQIKEDGNCGNHRNMTCYFNDSFTKKKKTKKKK